MMQERLEKEQEALQQRMDYQDSLLSERAKLDNLLAQNQAAILKLQGRISMLQDLIDDNDSFLRGE